MKNLNLVNLHAVLAAPLTTVDLFLGRPAPETPTGGPGAGGGPPGGGGGGGFGGGFGRGSDVDRPGAISLPGASWARAEQVVAAVSVAQTAIGVCLVIGWLLFVVHALRRRRAVPGARRRAAQ